MENTIGSMGRAAEEMHGAHGKFPCTPLKDVVSGPLLVEKEDMSSCSTRRHVFRRHVFLLNKKTCLLVLLFNKRTDLLVWQTEDWGWSLSRFL